MLGLRPGGRGPIHLDSRCLPQGLVVAVIQQWLLDMLLSQTRSNEETAGTSRNTHFGACALRNTPSTIAQIKRFFSTRERKRLQNQDGGKKERTSEL